VLKEIGGNVPQTDLAKVAQQGSRFPKWLGSALSQTADVA